MLKLGQKVYAQICMSLQIVKWKTLYLSDEKNVFYNFLNNSSDKKIEI